MRAWKRVINPTCNVFSGRQQLPIEMQWLYAWLTYGMPQSADKGFPLPDDWC